MNPGGIALMVLGAWVIAQITAGGAMGIITGGSKPKPAGAAGGGSGASPWDLRRAPGQQMPILPPK